jgi:hypothetical protein
MHQQTSHLPFVVALSIRHCVLVMLLPQIVEREERLSCGVGGLLCTATLPCSRLGGNRRDAA